jgi:hypothetical protein
MIAPKIEKLWERYRGKGLLIDSNLLLVYFVALFDPKLVGRFDRTRAFSRESVILLGNFITSFQHLATTPNILTEVSNLSNKLPENVRSEYFRSVAAQVGKLNETYLASSAVSEMPEFARFGLTDASIAGVARNRYLVLTDDFRISNFLRSEGQDVVNFNYILQSSWGL